MTKRFGWRLLVIALLSTAIMTAPEARANPAECIPLQFDRLNDPIGDLDCGELGYIQMNMRTVPVEPRSTLFKIQATPILFYTKWIPRNTGITVSYQYQFTAYGLSYPNGEVVRRQSGGCAVSAFDKTCTFQTMEYPCPGTAGQVQVVVGTATATSAGGTADGADEATCPW